MEIFNYDWPRVRIGLVHKENGRSIRIVELRGALAVHDWLEANQTTQIDSGAYSGVYVSWASAPIDGAYLGALMSAQAFNRGERWPELIAFLKGDQG